MVIGNTPSANLFDYTQQIDQTANRSIGTVFQNTTGRTMLVIVNFDTQFNAPGSIESIFALTDGSNPPGTVVSETSFTQSITARDIMEWPRFLVLPGNFYQVNASITAGGTIGLRRWIEYS